MANPFSLFRRNQRVLLAIVTIGAMVAFVFLDPVMKYISGGNAARQNPVVVETRYGAMHESELQAMWQQRKMVDSFLQQIAMETLKRQVERGMIDSRMANFYLERWITELRQMITTRSKAGPEEAAVETFVLAKQAEQMGMVVSDQAINDVLREISLDMLNRDDLIAIINHLGGRTRVSVKRVFDALRTELLASRLANMFAKSLSDIPPAQRFEYFERLNRRAKIEAAPLAVADFTARVADPSPTELTKFYDEYKDRFPDPNSPEPGFKQAKRAAFQYFKADFAKFTEDLKPTVTSEEIFDYYVKNKQQFIEVSLADDADENKDGDEKKDADTETPPTEEAKQPASTPPTESQPAATNEEPELPALADSDDPPTSPTDTAPTDTAPADPAQKATTADDPPPPPVTAVDEPAKTDADAAPVDDSWKPDPAAMAPPKEIRYEPLAKVSDKIRDSIAAEKARQKISDILDELTGKMRGYADDIDTYNAKKDMRRNAAPPKPFPFAELAKENGLEAKELPLSTAIEAAGEDIGKVTRSVQTGQFAFRNEPFADFAFSDSLVVYRPQSMQDSEGNNYLFWKTNEEAAYVPALDTIKDQVVLAWKMIEARAAARKRAEEYAAQARADRKPLAEVFAEQPNMKVTETPWFSWLTEGNVPFDQLSQQPRLSDVEGLDRIGREFMETVFSLPSGEVGVAINHPQNIVYVVRVAEYEKPLDELRKDFAIEPAQRYMPVAIVDQRKMYTAWLDDVNKNAKVKWIRPAESLSRTASTQVPLNEDDF